MAERPRLQRAARDRRRPGKVREPFVSQAHGGGGKAMQDLIDDVILGALDNPGLDVDEDQARLAIADLAAAGDRLAFTTDSYVVRPLFFPGGDIGKLAVHGTVNDLAVAGARPLYLSCALVLEEGLPIGVLRAVLASMGAAAEEAGVRIVTGDTKVVERGAADGMYVTTAGVGVIPRGVSPSARAVRPGDVVIASGTLGDHGAAIVVARGDLKLEAEIQSDSQPLHDLVAALVAAAPVHALRDATRGGVAAVLNEWAMASGVAIHLDAAALPVRPVVRGLCEVLGFDPLHLANEGKLVAAVPEEHAARALAVMRAHPRGRDAAIIGRGREGPPGVVTMSTGFGGERVVALPLGEQLPRIC
ncbi:hydrogenase expression/formation protein HypE [Sorangium sp. So ce1024]|uniref:hydrogenase expression/formation protein HypE n=1 Tax=Sorangium sp. So ce1024 TaxID=3133327 RepID=UPI003EFC283A